MIKGERIKNLYVLIGDTLIQKVGNAHPTVVRSLDSTSTSLTSTSSDSSFKSPQSKSVMFMA